MYNRLFKICKINLLKKMRYEYKICKIKLVRKI